MLPEFSFAYGSSLFRFQRSGVRVLGLTGILALALPAAMIPSAGSAQSWSMYDQYSTSYYIPFAPDPNNPSDPSRPDYTRTQTGMFVNASIAIGGQQSTVQTFLLDTGSEGVVIPGYLLPNYTPPPLNGPLQTVAYSSSGLTGYGQWVPANVIFNQQAGAGGPTSNVPVFVLSYVTGASGRTNCAAGDPSSRNCFMMMGVGYGRPGSGDNPIVTLRNNPLLNMTGMNMADPNAPVRAGYVITSQGIHAGLTAQTVQPGYAVIQLTSQSIGGGSNWATLPGQVTASGQLSSASNILLDTGINYAWGDMADASRASCVIPSSHLSVTCAAADVRFKLTFGDPNNPYELSYSYNGEGTQINAPIFTRENKGNETFNTGIHPFAGFSYFFDAVGGFVGLKPEGDTANIIFNPSFSTTGTLQLPNDFVTNLPVYVSGDTDILLNTTAAFSGDVSGPGILSIMGPGDVSLSGNVTLPSGIVVVAGGLTVTSTVVANVDVYTGATFASSGTLTGAVYNAGSFTNAGTLIGALTNLGNAQNKGLIQGAVTNQGSYTNSGTQTGSLANSGVFSNAAGATLTGAVTNAASGSLTNAGQVQGDVVSSGSYTNNGTQTGMVTNAGTFLNAGTMVGALSNSGDAENSGTLQGNATNSGFYVNSGTQTGSVTNTGTFLNLGTLVGNLSNSGGAQNGGAVQGDATNSGSYTNSGTHTGSVTNTGAFLNLGTLAGSLSNSASAQNTGTIQGNVLNSGTFSNDAGVAGSVTNQGLLIGNGTIGGNLVSSGRTSPGHSLGTIQVGGNATLASGSVYTAEVGPNGTSDLLAVGGVLESQGSTLQIIPLAGFNPSLGSSYTLMTAGGGVTGSFILDTVGFGATSSLYPFLATEVTSAGGNVRVELVRSPVRFAALAITPNQAAVANAADLVPLSSPLAAALAGVPLSSAAGAFSQLQGDIYASALSVLQTQSAYVRNAVTGRLLQTTSGLPAGGGPRAVDMPGLAGATLWGQAYAGWGSNDGNLNAAGYTSTIGGFLFGLDALVADWRVGLAAGFSQSQYDLSTTSSGESDNYDLAVYAGRSFGPLNLRMGAAYSWHDMSAQRFVSLPSLIQSYTSGYDGGTAQVFGEVGYGFAVPGLGVPVTLEPFAGLSYVALSTNGFTESAGTASLTGQSESFDTFSTTLGLRGSMTAPVGTVPVTLTGTLGWQHAYGDLTPTATLAFMAGGIPFTVSGAPLAADALIVAAGLSAQVGPNLSLGVSYNGQIASSVTENAVKGSFVWAF